MKPLFYGKQLVDEKDVTSVVGVLRSDMLSSGPKILEFEKQIASYCGAKYAVAVSSGTAALHLACLAAGLGKGDEGITTTMTFLASSNAILYCGAKSVLTDIDYETINIDPQAIQSAVTSKTKVIIPVHFAGLPADMKAIFRIAKKKKITVIEDASHALGASYCGDRIGACKYSDMTTFSFHPVKHITTGEGGCITTNNKKLYAKLLQLRNHGLAHSASKRKQHGDWYREMVDLGFNYRLTDIQSALGITQLKKLNSFLRRRRSIAKKYNQAFKDYQDVFRLPRLTFDESEHAWHLYVLRINAKKLGMSRRKFYDALKAEGVIAQVHYIPLHYHPYYKKHVSGKSRFPWAEKYYDEALSLPIYPSLKDSQVNSVIRAVLKIVKKAGKKKNERRSLVGSR